MILGCVIDLGFGFYSWLALEFVAHAAHRADASVGLHCQSGVGAKSFLQNSSLHFGISYILALHSKLKPLSWTQFSRQVHDVCLGAIYPYPPGLPEESEPRLGSSWGEPSIMRRKGVEPYGEAKPDTHLSFG